MVLAVGAGNDCRVRVAGVCEIGMIAAFAIIATIIAIACGVLIYAVGIISQRAERETEESYRELLRQKEASEAMERITRL